MLKKSIVFSLLAIFLLAGCVSKKKFVAVDNELSQTKSDLAQCESDLEACEKAKSEMATEMKVEMDRAKLQSRSNETLIAELRNQIDDLRVLRDKQLTQVGDLTVLSKAANDNINQTIKQMEKKDEYIKYLLAAKDKADSINLALSYNLKSVLSDGIADDDIDVQVDKTVVFINLSDKMLFRSGSYRLSSSANDVLEKIASVVKSNPDLEVMVEGYTDNVPISTSCMEDNWDLSVKRSTSVVRALETKHGVNPNKLVAAGRGENMAMADNSTAEGRSKNRRTRIILMPKLNQFYDLLKAPE